MSTSMVHKSEYHDRIAVMSFIIIFCVCFLFLTCLRIEDPVFVSLLLHIINFITCTEKCYSDYYDTAKNAICTNEK